MFSKLLAAKRAMHHGVTVNIINGRTKGILSSCSAAGVMALSSEPR
jgi:acetylglutamate kinase